MSKLTRNLKQQFQDYQQLPKLSPALLGDNFGNVYVPNKPNYVYVRINGFPLTEIYNTRVSPIFNLPVLVGFDPLEPDRYQVLCIRSNYPGIGFNFPEAKNVEGHHASHEYGNLTSGSDVVFSQLRQLMPLRPTPFGDMRVNYYRNVVWIGGEWRMITGSTIDYSPALPPSGAYYLLTYINQQGFFDSLTGTLRDANTLALSDIPEPPLGGLPVAAIRLFTGQTGIIEARTSSDLVDLRWNWMYTLATGTSGGGGIPEAPIDGNAYLREDASWVMYSGTSGGGGMPSGSYVPVTFWTEGILVTGSQISQTFMNFGHNLISNVYLYLEDLGSTGTTIIDIMKITSTGTYSVFSNPANRPTLDYNDADKWVVAVPDNGELNTDDVVFMDIVQTAVGAGTLSATLSMNGGALYTSGGGSTGTSGGGNPLLAITCYDPASNTDSTVTNIFAAFDSTNLIVTFVAPSSGNVLVKITSGYSDSVVGDDSLLGLLEGATQIASRYRSPHSTNRVVISEAFYITGVTPGSHTYKFAGKSDYGTLHLSYGSDWGQFIMEVWACP